MGVSKTYLKKEIRYYLKLVFMTKEYGTERTEVVADSQPCIKVQDGKAWFCFKKHRGGRINIGLDKLNFNNSTSIKRVLSIIKMSTCKEDKLFLGEVNQILKEKVMLETVNDTERVKGFPKRITVFMFPKKTTLEFERVALINITAYLTKLLKKLEVPPHVNTLEVEAIDIVKARLDLVTEELKQLHQEDLKRKKEASKQIQNRIT